MARKQPQTKAKAQAKAKSTSGASASRKRKIGKQVDAESEGEVEHVQPQPKSLSRHTISDPGACSRMLGWLKYQADASKNKKGGPQQVAQASAALKAKHYVS
jgi:hypothetical protein